MQIKLKKWQWIGIVVSVILLISVAEYAGTGK